MYNTPMAPRWLRTLWVILPLAALIALGAWLRRTAGVQPDWATIVIGAILVGVLVNYPIPFGVEEVSLVHAVSLGLGMAHGPGPMGLALAVGLTAGEVVRAGWKRAPAPRPGGWWERARASILSWSIHSLSLFGSLTVYQEFAGGAWLAETGRPPELIPSLWLGISFTILFMAMSWLNHRLVGIRPLTSREAATFSLITVLPIPYAIFAAVAYLKMGVAGLVVLGGVPTLVSPILRGLMVTELDLQRRLSELSTLSRVSQAMRTSLDLESLLTAIYHQVARLLQIDNFYVALLNPDDQEISYPMAIREGVRQEWKLRPVVDRLTDRVIRSQAPLLVPSDGAIFLRRLGLPDVENAPEAWLGVPLHLPGRTLGCMGVFHITPGRSFSDRDLDILLTLSGQAAVAIDHSLLYEQTRKRAQALASLNEIAASISSTLDLEKTLELISQSMTRVGGGQKSAIFLLDRGRAQLNLARSTQLSPAFVEASATIPLEDQDRAAAIHSRTPVLVPDIEASRLPRSVLERFQAEQIRAFADFPLAAPEGLIGLVSVYFTEPQRFQPDQIELLKTFAAQAAVAVVNSRAHAETDQALRRRVDQLSILEAIGREMTAKLEPQELYAAILGHALHIAQTDMGHLAILEADNGGFRIVAERGYPQGSPAKDRGRVYPAEKGAIGQAFRTCEPCNFPHVQEVPDYLDLSMGAVQSVLSVPILRQGRCLAVIALESPQPGAFSAEDQQLVSQLAAPAAVALTNSLLYQQLEARLREQSLLYQASTQIASTLETETVAMAVADSLEVALSADAASISLWNQSKGLLLLQAAVQDGRPAIRGWVSSVPLADAPALARCLEQGTPLQWTAENAPTPQDREYLSGIRRASSLLAVPMSAGRERLGLLEVYSRTTRLFDENEMRTAQTIASQAAVGLQNTDLFHRISESHERLTAVLNSTQEGMLMADTFGRVVLLNAQLGVLTGLAVDTLVGKSLSELESEVSAALGYRSGELANLIVGLESGTASATGATSYDIEHPFRRHLQRSEAPVLDASNLLIGWLIVLRDVSEDRRLEEARRHLTEMIVHDLRGPLTAILSSLKLLEGVAGAQAHKPVARQALSVSQKSCQQMLGLVNSLLDIAKLEAGELQLSLSPLSVDVLCRELIATYVIEANEQGVILNYQAASRLPRIRADAEKVRRVLANLLDNALKFTPAGGHVDLTVDRKADSLLICVTDSGPGIAEDFRERVFDRFAQVPGVSGRRLGSGLGLAFSKLAVEAHGGRIWVEANPEGGSLFGVMLPIGGPQTGA